MRRSTSPLTTLQVAATVSALLFAPLPAFAQAAPPAAAPPAPPVAASPGAPAAPKAAPAPKTPPPPARAPRVPGSDIPTEPAPLPPWQPTAEPPVTATPDTPPAGTGTPAEPPPVGTPPDAGTPPESTPPVAEGPAPAPEPAAKPVDPVKANKLRVAGMGTMIAGGVLSLAGFAMILGFSIRGNKFEEKLVTIEDKFSTEGCSGKGGKECNAIQAERTEIRNGILFSDYYTKLAGAGLAAGLLVTAIGGIIYRRGMKGLSNNVARVRVSPSWGGLSVSGRF